MKINEVEALVGITKKNIRFYEEKGLLSPRRNSENGYREYGQEDAETLQRIKLLRKLGVPIEEIRSMQEKKLTLEDGMRRHVITLERERQNLEESIRFCHLLKEKGQPLEELDAAALLQEMADLEKSGTTFRNKQKQDIRSRYVAPIVISLLIILFLTGTAWLMFWAFSLDPETRPPLFIFILFTALPLLAACGVLYALFQRIREIKEGEIDDAKQY